MNSHNSEFTCIYEAKGFGVFQIPSNGEETCIIARIPASWRTARASRQVIPSPEGEVEKPSSILTPFTSETEAIKTLNKWAS